MTMGNSDDENGEICLTENTERSSEMRLSAFTGKRMLHLHGKSCQPSSTRIEESTNDFTSFFRMRPASFRFTSFRRASGRQSTRQTSLRTTTRDFVTRQSSRSNSPMRICWNDSPAWFTAITTDGSPGKHIADFRKHIRSCWRCSRIEFSACTIKVYT